MDTISNYTESGNHRFPKRPELHTIPPEYTWAEPSNYGGCPLKFMAGETRHAFGSPNPNYQVVDLDCETGFKLVPFSKTPAAVAVTGLCGCTSIIIVSRRGAWANHIWEEPSMISVVDTDYEAEEFDPGYTTRREASAQEQFPIFKREVLDTLLQLKDLRNNWDSSDPAAISSLFSDDAHPNIYIFGPYGWHQSKKSREELQPCPKDTPMQYEEYNDMMKKKLWEIFGPSVPIKVIPYTQRRHIDGDAGDGDAGDGDAGDVEFLSHEGKVLVQYRPAIPCKWRDVRSKKYDAAWRIWFEGRLEQEHNWGPMGEFQISDFTPEGPRAATRS